MKFKSVNDVLQKRGEVIHEMKAMLDTASGEGRDLNSDES